MNVAKQIGLGTNTYFRAFGFIFNNGLAWFFLVPLALNILLFFGTSMGATGVSDLLSEWIKPFITFDADSFWGAEWITEYMPGIFQAILLILFKIFFFFLFAYFGGYIVLILLSPALAFLSEKTEMILTGNQYPFDLLQTVRDALRGVMVALRNALIEVLWMIGLFFFSFIPVVGIASPFLGFAISSYFYGFSYMDYYSERRRMTMMQSVRYIRKHKYVAFANGALFALLLIIPYCGVFLAGFAAIVACVGATLAMHELLDKQGDLSNVDAPAADSAIKPDQLKGGNPQLPNNNEEPPPIEPSA